MTTIREQIRARRIERARLKLLNKTAERITYQLNGKTFTRARAGAPYETLAPMSQWQRKRDDLRHK